MIPRQAAPVLRDLLRQSPAVALVGPRQCGKTTLARSLGGAYYDLEQEPERLRLDLEWPRRTDGDELIVLDEAQAWPEVFPRLRGEIDRRRARRGRFLLLGSVSPALMTRVSESLAGRLSLLELTPLLWGELSAAARDRLWLRGGYPEGGVLDPQAYPRWQRDYLTLLAQRDLPAWGLPAKPAVTHRLLRMLAALQGQTWNASQVAAAMGLDYKTVNGYLDYLEGAFLIRRLPPFSGNLRKRLTKSPKLHWRDTGLLHALLNVPDEPSLLVQPWVGASWEGFIVEQTLGTLASMGASFDAFHLRTSDGYEVDLVLDFGRERWAIEAKLTTSPGPGDMARLNKAADLIQAHRRFLVSRTPRSTEEQRFASCDLPFLLDRLRKGP